jgi:hypothetical protein
MATPLQLQQLQNQKNTAVAPKPPIAQQGYGIGYGTAGAPKGYTDKNAEIERTKAVLQNRTAQGMDNTAQLSHYTNLTGQAYQTAPTTPTAPAGFDQAAYLKQQQDGVNSIYDAQKKAQLAQLYASRDKATGLINQQKAEVAPQYADKRNQSDVVNAQNVSRLREMMASNGLQGSGENVTANVGLQSARQGALGNLNLQEQQTMNDYNRQITDLNDPASEQALIAQLEAQRAQAMMDANNRADDTGYARGRDVIGDQRYNSETQYNHSQDKTQADYQSSRDKLNDYWTQRNYDASRYDKAKDYNYQAGRDKTADTQWQKQYDASRADVSKDQAWREKQFNNMSASEKAQMAWDKQKYGEDAAWRLYDQQYQGDLSKSQSDAELKAYTSP